MREIKYWCNICDKFVKRRYVKTVDLKGELKFYHHDNHQVIPKYKGLGIIIKIK